VTTSSKRVVVGRIVGTHGVRGQVRVRYFGDGPESLLDASELWLADSDEDPSARRVVVERAGTGRAGEVRLTLPDVRTREAAQELRGSLLLVDAAALEALPEGEFYWHELVGCAVEDTQGRSVGRVVEIWDTGAHDVLVVESRSGKRHLLPTARELMPEIDLAANRIVVEALPGLLDE